MSTILGSIGGALGVAAHAGTTNGRLLAHLARTAFVDGMHLGMLTAAIVALAGVLITLIALPSRRAGVSPTQRRRR